MENIKYFFEQNKDRCEVLFNREFKSHFEYLSAQQGSMGFPLKFTHKDFPPLGVKIVPKGAAGINAEIEILSRLCKLDTPGVIKNYYTFDCDYTNSQLLNLKRIFNSPWEINKIPKKRSFVFIVTNWARHKDLFEFINSNISILTPLDIKCLLFQIIESLATIQKKYPFFRHNDLHEGNILVFQNQDTTLQLYSSNNKIFKVPTRGINIKLWDFDRSNIKGIVDNKRYSSDNKKNTDKNHYLDLFNIMARLKHLLYHEKFKKETDFIEKAILKKYRKIDVEGNVFESRGKIFKKDIKVGEKWKLDRMEELTTPKQLLDHLYFRDFRKKLIVAFDMDHTIGSFGIFYDLSMWIIENKIDRDIISIDSMLDTMYDDKNSFFDIMFRPGILDVFKDLNEKRKKKICEKIILFTNNNRCNFWPEMISGWLNKRLRFKLFDCILCMPVKPNRRTKWKAERKPSSTCRQSQHKNLDEFLKCAGLNKQDCKILFFDDKEHKQMMENTVVKYIKVPIYNPYTEYDILDKYIDKLDELFEDKKDGDRFGQVFVELERIKTHKKKKEGKIFRDREEIIKVETNNFFENYFNK